MGNIYSSKHIIRVLQNHGFFYISQKGSHAKFRKEYRKKVFTVIIPVSHKEIPVGTFRSILRQSGLSEDDFKKR